MIFLQRFIWQFILPAIPAIWFGGDSLSAVAAAANDDSRAHTEFLYQFEKTSPLPAATVAAAAANLSDGNVLVTGGYGKLFGHLPIVTSLARLYDHCQRQWRISKGRLNYGRFGHAMIPLADGRIIIAGGLGQDRKTIRSVELFDPSDESFTLIGKLAIQRKRPRLNLIGPNKVLVSGFGRNMEIIEQVVSGEFHIRTVTTKSYYNHTDHVAINLRDGTVLLVGGRTSGLERFDPADETFFHCSVRLPNALDDQSAALLFDGRVLLAGGQEIFGNRCVDKTWIYDPQSDSLIDGPILKPTAQGLYRPGTSDMALVDLFGGDESLKGKYIFMCGGEYDPGGQGQDVILDSAWVYDAMADRFVAVGPMLVGHDDFAAVPLPSDSSRSSVLIIAGHGPADSFQNTCEMFTFMFTR